MRYPNRPTDFGSKSRKVAMTSSGAAMPPRTRTGYADGGAVASPFNFNQGISLKPIQYEDQWGNEKFIDPITAWDKGMYQWGGGMLPGMGMTPEDRQALLPAAPLPPRADAANPSTLSSVPYREVNLDSLRGKGKGDLDALAAPMRENFAKPISPTPGFAGGGLVAPMTPPQPMDPEDLIPPPGGGGAGPNRFGTTRGRTPLKRIGYADGGDVNPAETYVTGDQLAGQVQQRFGQILEADDKVRRGYDDGGYVDETVDSGGGDSGGDEAAAAAAEEERRRQEEAERARQAEEQAEADRQAQAAAVEESERTATREEPAPEQTQALEAAPEQVQAAEQALQQAQEQPQPQQEPTEPYQVAALDPNMPVPSREGQQAGQQTLEAAKAQTQTDDWLREVLEYSHAQIDPSELGPQDDQTGRLTGYNQQLAQAGTGVMTDATGSMAGPVEAPASATGTEPPALPAIPPGTPPPPNEIVPPTRGFGSLLAAGARNIGQSIYQGATDPYAQTAAPGKTGFDSTALGAGLNAVKMSIADLVRGKGAFPPEQMMEILQSDPRGDHNTRVQETFDSFKGNPAEGFKFMQGLRPIFDNSIGFAQAAESAGRPDAVARGLEGAHNMLPNSERLKVDPIAGGYRLTTTSERDPNAAPQVHELTTAQMSEFLKSNASQFDSLAYNRMSRNLDVLTGKSPYQPRSPEAEPYDRLYDGSKGPVSEPLEELKPEPPYVPQPSAAASQAGVDPDKPYDALATEQKVTSPTRTATGEQGEGFDPRMTGYQAGASERTIEPATPDLYAARAREDAAAARAGPRGPGGEPLMPPGRRVGSVRDVMESNTMASPRSYNPGSLKGIYPKNRIGKAFDDGYYIPNAEQIDAGFVAQPAGQNYGSKWERAAHAQQTKRYNALGNREATAMDTGLPFGTYRDAEGTLRYGSYARAGESSRRGAAAAPAEPATRRIGSPYASAGSGAEEEVISNERAARGPGGGPPRGAARERPGDMVVHTSGYDPSGAPAYSTRQVGGPMLREQLGHPAFMDPTYRYPNDIQPIYPRRTADGTVIPAQIAADARRDSPDHGYGGRAGRGPVGPDMRRADEESLRGMGFKPEDYVVKGPQGEGSIQEARSRTPIGPAWTPVYGRGSVAPPPPTTLNTPAARAARQYPGTTDYATRRTAEQVFQQADDAQRKTETEVRGRENVARIAGTAKEGAAATSGQARIGAAEARAKGTTDSATIRAASNERISTEREDGRMMRNEDKIAVARENLDFLRSKAVADIESRIGNQDTRNLFGAMREKIRAFQPLNEKEQSLYDETLAQVRERGGRSPHAYIKPDTAPAGASRPRIGGTEAPVAAPAAAPAAAPPAGSDVTRTADALAAGKTATAPANSRPQVRSSGGSGTPERPDLKTYTGRAIPWPAPEGQKWQRSPSSGLWRLVPM